MRARWSSLIRRIPPDVIALAVIAFVMLATQRSLVRRGFRFDDATSYFHFGRRVLGGAVPYRDFALPFGPLPIYVDAGFQALLGPTYMASLYAALFIHTLRVVLMWMIARRLAGFRAAVAVCVFAAFDPAFGTSQPGASSYVELFVAIAIVCVMRATATEHRRRFTLAAAGVSLALVWLVIPSSAIVVGVVSCAAMLALLGARIVQAAEVAAFVAGYAAMALACLICLVALGAAGAGLLDVPRPAELLDAVLGGALHSEAAWGPVPVPSRVLHFFGIPAMCVVALGYLAAKNRQLAARELAVIAVPLGFCVALAMRHATLDDLTGLPRVFLTAVAVFAVCAPRRLQAWSGIEPLVAAAIAVFAIAADWAVALGLPGATSSFLISGVVLIALSSSHVGPRAKAWLGAALAAAVLIHISVLLATHVNPFMASDGPFGASTLSTDHPALRAIKVSSYRKAAIHWVIEEIPAGSTCFVHGDMPVLYTLLGCSNPTELDSTAAEFRGGKTDARALEALRRNPPDFIIITTGQVVADDVLSAGVSTLLASYDSLGRCGDAIGAPPAASDGVEALTIYRRRR